MIASGLAAALFVIAAALQYNDPDPVRWVGIYLSAAVVTMWMAVRPNASVIPALLVGAVTLGWAIGLASDGSSAAAYLHMFDSWEMRSQEVEETREASGLLLVAAWFALIAARKGGPRRHERA